MSNITTNMQSIYRESTVTTKCSIENAVSCERLRTQELSHGDHRYMFHPEAVGTVLRVNRETPTRLNHAHLPDRKSGTPIAASLPDRAGMVGTKISKYRGIVGIVGMASENT